MSKEFEAISNDLDKYDLSSFAKPSMVEEYCNTFGIREICAPVAADRIESSNEKVLRSVSADELKPYEPKWSDLCRLHWLQLSRRAVTILELGSGFSTGVLAAGARLLGEHFGDWAGKNLRSEQPFHVYSIEEEQRFLQITASRLDDRLSPYVSLSRSSVEMILFDQRIATVYSDLPNVSPDFVFLDGPSQFATTQTLNGFSFCSPARMPMSADLLRVEFFLEPGTLIIVDGRTANARFLRHYFKRNWAYLHDTDCDIHLFELQEDPLGEFNRRKIEFCLNGSWLLPSA